MFELTRENILTDDARALIEAAFKSMPDVWVKPYEPKGSPDAKDIFVKEPEPDRYRRIKADLKP